MNRYTRDEILHRALDMAKTPTLDINDRPQEVFLTTALSIKWLQEALDIFHVKFPWASDIVDVNVVVANAGFTITLPDDFVLDVRDGLLPIHPTTLKKVRAKRFNYQKFLSFDLSRQGNKGRPLVYAFKSNSAKTAKEMIVSPVADQAYNCTLHYYHLPAVLEADDIPIFPTDHALVEYVRIRVGEWVSFYPPGTAQAMAEKEIARLQASGLANEPESDVVEYDNSVYGKMRGGNSWDWMGQVVS